MAELVAVPNLPGVPAVSFAPGYDVRPTLLAGDDPAALAAFANGSSQWGLFRNGQSVIQADGVAAFDHRREWVVCDYPVEQGAFASFNKVNIPFDVRLVFMAGLNTANRADLIESVTAIAGDLNFYDAVMPEKVWHNLNVTHVDFSRTAQRGVGLLMVAVWCREIRQASASASAPGSAGAGNSSTAGDNPSASGGIGDTASPSGANPVDGGVVQARDPTATEMSAVATQDFSGGYNVSGYNANPTYSADVGEAVFTDPSTGQEVGRVPGGSALPQTSSTISGLSPAGPDTFSSLNVGSVPGIS
ncbi:hypothetical protein ABC766_32165 (plasmid) [Methylobacterium fujisawaense]|uniref:hypothetical protein n=1 Tax=Methylobacterium fujisawaense TaxID=107400 RepID=UPI0031F4E2B0